MPVYHGDPDLMWIEEVVEQFGRSRATLERLIDEGKLHRVRFEGDRRVFLRRSEAEPLLSQPFEDVPGRMPNAG